MSASASGWPVVCRRSVDDSVSSSLLTHRYDGLESRASLRMGFFSCAVFDSGLFLIALVIGKPELSNGSCCLRCQRNYDHAGIGAQCSRHGRRSKRLQAKLVRLVPSTNCQLCTLRIIVRQSRATARQAGCLIVVARIGLCRRSEVGGGKAKALL